MTPIVASKPTDQGVGLKANLVAPHPCQPAPDRTLPPNQEQGLPVKRLPFLPPSPDNHAPDQPASSW